MRILVLATATATALAACQPSDNIHSALARGEASVCVAPSVLQTVDDLTAEAEAEARDIAELADRSFTRAIDASSVVMLGFDEATHLMTCQGDLKISHEGDDKEVRVEFTVQPTADGSAESISFTSYGDVRDAFASFDPCSPGPDGGVPVSCAAMPSPYAARPHSDPDSSINPDNRRIPSDEERDYSNAY